MPLNVIYIELFAVACLAISLRAINSLHPYSGENKPPMYGDYEAQRHWQEIAVNLAPKEWYKNSTSNDLMYWGLDYPPLTAYHSRLTGIIATSINKSYVSLNHSRGFECHAHKTFMRLTVLLADILIYIPTIIFLCTKLKKQFNTFILPLVFTSLIYPGQILIDNGHFQYNNISLGLAAFAIALLLQDNYYLSALFYTLALNYKQMELYHAIPFFLYLLGICFQQKSFLDKIVKFAKIGCTVLITFIILWLPWIHSLKLIRNVIERLFPIKRGVFEDKVANIWCAVNVIYKLKKEFTNQQLALLCIGTTVTAILPNSVNLFIHKHKENFLLSLTNTAMAFFLFSFQVHEKSILIVALPAICLFPICPHIIFWFLEITVFSMLPLFMKDNITLSFACMLVLYRLVTKNIYLNNFQENQERRIIKHSFIISEICMLLLFLCSLLGWTPLSYPHFWPLLISVFSCFHYLMFFVYLNFYQLFPQKLKIT